MFIWDNGNKEKDVVEVNKYGEMALAIRDIGWITWLPVLEGWFIQMVTHTKDNGNKIELKDLVNYEIIIGIYIHTCGATFKGSWKNDKQ